MRLTLFIKSGLESDENFGFKIWFHSGANLIIQRFEDHEDIRTIKSFEVHELMVIERGTKRPVQ